jgi:uncharacterized membrane protein
MTNRGRDLFQLERLAFFSDAVFAIAITLLVIEVRMPELESVTDADLANALLSLTPKFIGFLVSFLVIGRFWIGHHTVFSHLKTCDAKLVWRNLLLLLTIAFMPFPTALLSEYGGNRVAFAVYASWLIAVGVFYHRVVVHALGTPALLFDHDDAVSRQALIHASWAPIIVGLLALASGLYHPPYAFIPLLGAPLIVAATRALGYRFAKKSAKSLH